MRWIKESMVLIIIFLIILFTIIMLFYDCLPFSQDRVKSVEYEATEKIKTIMEDVETRSVVKKEGEAQTLKIYSVDKSDLTVHSGEGYETGKKDPFAEVSDTVDEVITTEITEGETAKANSSNPVENEGTFFENKNSK